MVAPGQSMDCTYCLECGSVKGRDPTTWCSALLYYYYYHQAGALKEQASCSHYSRQQKTRRGRGRGREKEEGRVGREGRREFISQWKTDYDLDLGSLFLVVHSYHHIYFKEKLLKRSWMNKILEYKWQAIFLSILISVEKWEINRSNIK